MQSMGNANNSTYQSSLPVKNTKNSVFQSDEKKMEVKFALKQEDRVDTLRKLMHKAPKLELKVSL